MQTIPGADLQPPSRESMRAWIEGQGPCPWPDARETEAWSASARETYCSVRILGASHDEALVDPSEIDEPGIEATDEVLDASIEGRMPAGWRR